MISGLSGVVKGKDRLLIFYRMYLGEPKMRKELIGLVICIWLMGCAPMSSKEMKPGRQSAQSFSKKITKMMGCDYLLYLPADYGKDTKKQWPLIMFLHGGGERGKNLAALKSIGLPKMISRGRSFDFIIVSPQCPNDTSWTEQSEVLINLLDEVKAKYKVDTDRIYLTGLSMGGFGTWSIAAKDPERFAAIAPICGGGERFASFRLKKVPVWAFHGAKDPLVPVASSQEMVDAVNKAGGDAKLTIYPEAGHDSWTQTYYNPELYKWFLSHRISDKKK
jgi:predicted peptidase